MKKIIAMVLCLVLVFSLAGCGNNDQSSDTHDANYEEGYNLIWIMPTQGHMHEGFLKTQKIRSTEDFH